MEGHKSKITSQECFNLHCFNYERGRLCLFTVRISPAVNCLFSSYVGMVGGSKDGGPNVRAPLAFISGFGSPSHPSWEAVNSYHQSLSWPLWCPLWEKTASPPKPLPPAGGRDCRPWCGTDFPSQAGPPPQHPPSLTFAVFPIPRVARLADALVGPRGVLAESINVAAIGPLHTFIHIWQGQRGHMRWSAHSTGALKVVPQGQNPLSSKIDTVTLPETDARPHPPNFTVG